LASFVVLPAPVPARSIRLSSLCTGRERHRKENLIGFCSVFFFSPPPLYYGFYYLVCVFFFPPPTSFLPNAPPLSSKLYFFFGEQKSSRRHLVFKRETSLFEQPVRLTFLPLRLFLDPVLAHKSPLFKFFRFVLS